MYIPPSDRCLGEAEWRPFVAAQGFGHLAARGGPDRRRPVVQPTQYILDGDEVLLHLAAPNPMLDALAEHPEAVLSVAGDWAFIPSDWKTIADEDPALGIPTTYYAAVQLAGPVRVERDPAAVAAVLRRQLAELQPGVPVADPKEAHPAQLRAIRAIVLTIDDVQAKFKYGGNVDEAHRRAVIARLDERDRPGDRAAAAHTARRLEASDPPEP
ncbi:MAG TPA: FMN-binding negative transcriptional regulator [Acidimicrobiales bacterium]|nr:FMN-binding negative transcriptional regulator [Acidimicrobiales bacterium]